LIDRDSPSDEERDSAQRKERSTEADDGTGFVAGRRDLADHGGGRTYWRGSGD
jgi:hypothetical protein